MRRISEVAHNIEGKFIQEQCRDSCNTIAVISFVKHNSKNQIMQRNALLAPQQNSEELHFYLKEIFILLRNRHFLESRGK